jgi:hypothetical protein
MADYKRPSEKSLSPKINVRENQMSAEMCKGCGAPLDPLFQACIYCNAANSQFNPDSVSNEQLIMKTEKWIGSVRQGWAAPEKRHGQSSTKIIADLFRASGKQECIGIAKQYLSIFELRATANPNLSQIATRLRSDLNKAESEESSREKQSREAGEGMKKLVVVCVVVGLLLIILSAMGVIE